MVHQQKLIILLSCLICGSIEAFMQSPLQQQQQQGGAVKSASTTSKLNGYIAADADEEQVDMSLGGVGLAHESALVMVGNVDRKGSPIATDLLRYTDVTSLDEKQLGEHSISVLCKGEGTEVYQDPGTGTDSTIILAPYEAIAEALTSIDLSVVGKDAKKIVINYCGGEDLLVHEVFGSLQSLFRLWICQRIKVCSLDHFVIGVLHLKNVVSLFSLLLEGLTSQIMCIGMQDNGTLY